MACAHSFNEWCGECIAGMVDQFNQCRRKNDDLTAKLEAAQVALDQISRWSHDQHAVDIANAILDGSPITNHGESK